MGTHCNIGYLDRQTGKFVHAYCHNDGYESAVGAELVARYPTYESATDLVDRGNMSYPGKDYFSQEGRWQRNKPSLSEAIEDLLEFTYTYIFIDDEWMVVKGRHLEPLEWRLHERTA